MTPTQNVDGAGRRMRGQHAASEAGKRPPDGAASERERARDRERKRESSMAQWVALGLKGVQQVAL